MMSDKELIEKAVAILNDWTCVTSRFTEDVAKEIISLCNQSKWISVDNPPESGQQILIRDKRGLIFNGWCDDFNTEPSRMTYFAESTQATVGSITHWQPLQQEKE